MINKIILIDADVVSHFISGGEAHKIHTIFPHPIKVLDKVYKELSKLPKKKIKVDELLTDGIIELIEFPDDNAEIKKEYFHIKKLMFKGDGEAACLAVVRYSKNIIASSNLKDIKSYCLMHNIVYLTTMDFLCEALRKEILTETECNSFIRKVLAVKSKLPVKNMKEFSCREITI